jgi:cytidine deaminase
MKKVELNQLSKKQIELIEAAIQVRKNAYAPYSKFKVGAAVLMKMAIYIQVATLNLSITHSLRMQRWLRLIQW